jgi:hypothetical protein
MPRHHAQATGSGRARVTADARCAWSTSAFGTSLDERESDPHERKPFPRARSSVGQPLGWDAAA